MDGLRAHENVSVVLTTNAIERLEAAIKDRPGRISQCIFMGPPNPELRRRFLSHQLASHDLGEVELEALVAQSEGATQAFLKEWVLRAVQIACERIEDDTGMAQLKTADFAEAMEKCAVSWTVPTARSSASWGNSDRWSGPLRPHRITHLFGCRATLRLKW